MLATHQLLWNHSYQNRQHQIMHQYSIWQSFISKISVSPLYRYFRSYQCQFFQIFEWPFPSVKGIIPINESLDINLYFILSFSRTNSHFYKIFNNIFQMRFVLFVGLLIYAQAISFYAQEGKEKCFQDEIPSRTVVIVYYDMKSDGLTKEEREQVQKGSTVKNVELRIYGPDQKLLHTHETRMDTKKFSFTSKASGRYKICVMKAKSFWKQNEYKFSLKVQQGVDYNLQDAANKTHVEALNQRIDTLTNRTREFISLQQLNREQEDKLTSKSIEINQRVIQTTVVQIVVLVVSGVYQIWSLRRFFKSRFLL